MVVDQKFIIFNDESRPYNNAIKGLGINILYRNA